MIKVYGPAILAAQGLIGQFVPKILQPTVEKLASVRTPKREGLTMRRTSLTAWVPTGWKCGLHLRSSTSRSARPFCSITSTRYVMLEARQCGLCSRSEYLPRLRRAALRSWPALRAASSFTVATSTSTSPTCCRTSRARSHSRAAVRPSTAPRPSLATARAVCTLHRPDAP